MIRRAFRHLVPVLGAAWLASCSTLIGIEDITHYVPDDGGAGANGAGGTVGASGSGGSDFDASSGASGSSSGSGGTGKAEGGTGGSPQLESGADTTSALDADTVCKDHAAAVCAMIDSCAYLMKTAYGSTTTCLAREKISCLEVLSAPGTGFTPASMQACTRSMSSGQGCLSYVPAPGCRPRGTLPDGAKCWTSSQCLGGDCLIPGGNACGICGQPAVQGGDCYSYLDCVNAPQMYCRTTSVTKPGTCTPGVTLGNQCTDITGLYCQPDLWCNKGVCTNAPRPQLNEPCDPIDQRCDDVMGLTCDSTTRKCTALTVGDPGQLCPSYVCAAGGACKDPNLSTRMCVASVTEGQACDEVNATRCLSPAFCLNKVCVLPNQRCQ
jgi:hypothetical protein